MKDEEVGLQGRYRYQSDTSDFGNTHTELVT